MNEITPTMRSNGDAHSGFKEEHGLVAHTLRASGHDASEDGTGRGTPLTGGAMPNNQVGVRRLTPVECERLQSLPDDWTRYGINEAGEEFELSDNARYFVCGNAVTANVAEWIGCGIPKELPEKPF